MKDHILFDTTDADTIAASDKILSGLVSSSDGSTLITDTLVGGKQGLDVNVINASLTTTTGSEYAEDAAHTTGDIGNFILAVANHTEGALHSADGDYAALQVDSSGRLRVVADLDTTNLAEKAEDDAHSSGDIGNYVLAVRQDTLATDTSTDGDYASFKVNASGELYTTDESAIALLTTIDADTSAIAVDVAAIETELLDQGTTLDSILSDTNALVVDVAAIEAELLDQGTTLDTIAGDTTSIDATLTALSKAEDSVHSSGDQGIMSLAVRNDAGTALAADGDYIPLTTDSTGQLRVSASDAALANTSIANAANALGVANTAEDVVASPLANRKYLWIYNNGNKLAYVGATGVTSSNGFPLTPGSYLEMRAGASVDIEWVSSDTNQELRTLELS